MAYPVYEGNGGIAAGGDYAVDVPWVSGSVEDDIVLVKVGDADNDDFDQPSGWLQVAEFTTNANFSSAWYWHRVTSAEEGSPPSSVTFTSTLLAGTCVAGVMYRFSGCVTDATPYENAASAGVTQGTTGTISSISTDGTDRLCVCLVGIEDNIGCSDDATDYSRIMDALTDVSTTEGGDMGFGLYTYQQATADTVAADSFTVGGNDYWTTFTFALVPAPSGPATVYGDAVLEAIGLLEAEALCTVYATGTLDGDGLLTADGFATTTGASTIAATGLLDADGEVSKIGTATIAATGLLTADGIATVFAASSPAATGLLTADGIATVFAAAGLSAAGLLEADGICVISNDGTIAAVGLLTAEGTVSAGGPIEIFGDATMVATGLLDADGLATAFGNSSIAATGLLDADGYVVVFADGIIVATGLLDAEAWVTVFGAANIAAVTLLTANGFIEGEVEPVKRLPRWFVRNMRHTSSTNAQAGQKEVDLQ